jgi:hypothetical protein
MDTAMDLEQWLRKEASERSQHASSRRSGAESLVIGTDQDREVAHQIAEQTLGRKIAKTSKVQDEQSAKIQERIAVKLDNEATMLLGFADTVKSLSWHLITPDNPPKPYTHEVWGLHVGIKVVEHPVIGEGYTHMRLLNLPLPKKEEGR